MFAAHAVGLAEVQGDLRKYSGEFSRTGVCVFFLISGFLLYRPFVAGWWKGGRDRIRDVRRRRLLRIVPAYWVALALVALYYGQGVTSGNWWQFALFGQVYRSDTFSNGIGPAWTLCVEMTFYAVLPLLAFVASRVGRQVPRAEPPVPGGPGGRVARLSRPLRQRRQLRGGVDAAPAPSCGSRWVWRSRS